MAIIIPNQWDVEKGKIYIHYRAEKFLDAHFKKSMHVWNLSPASGNCNFISQNATSFLIIATFFFYLQLVL